MAKQHILLLIVACIHHIAYAASLKAAATGTAYDILDKNNLLHGLLPQGVELYVLNPDGKLEVTLARQCEIPVTFGSQQLKFRFSSTVGGVIKPGSIHEVYGVDVQIKFGWLGIRQVDRAGDQLTFQAKQFTQSFNLLGYKACESLIWIYVLLLLAAWYHNKKYNTILCILVRGGLIELPPTRPIGTSVRMEGTLIKF